MLIYMMDVDDYKQFVVAEDKEAAKTWLKAQRVLNKKMDGWDDDREWVLVGNFTAMTQADAALLLHNVTVLGTSKQEQEQLETTDMKFMEKHGFDSKGDW